MITSKLKLEHLNESEWNKLLPEFRDRNFSHEWTYVREMAKREGSLTEFLAITDDRKTLALCALRVKKIPLIGLGVAHVSGGPLVASNDNLGNEHSCLQNVLEQLALEYGDRGGLVVRVNPGILGSCEEWLQERDVPHDYVQSSRHSRYRTVVVDLASDLEQLRKQLAKKWRYELKQSEKAGLIIEEGSDDSFHNRFNRLFSSMLDRKQFTTGLYPEFFAMLQKKGNSNLRLFIARHGEEDVAGLLLATGGDVSTYLLGATNDKALKLRAGFYCQWHAFRISKECGHRWYDLHGIDPESNPGGSSFKINTGGRELFGSGPWDYYPSTLKGNLSRIAEKAVHLAKDIVQR